MHHAAIRPQEINPGLVPALFEKQLRLCRLRKGETLALVTDLGTRREYIEAAFAAAEMIGADVYELKVNEIGRAHV